MTPERFPSAKADIRIAKSVAGTVPSLGVRTTWVEYSDPEAVLISNPVGAVTVISPRRLLPETVNGWVADAVP